MSGARRPGCVDLPGDDGDQNDRQRSCFWWFMEVGEWGGTTPGSCGGVQGAVRVGLRKWPRKSQLCRTFETVLRCREPSRVIV